MNSHKLVCNKQISYVSAHDLREIQVEIIHDCSHCTQKAESDLPRQSLAREAGSSFTVWAVTGEGSVEPK